MQNLAKHLSIDKPWAARYLNNPNADFNLKETLYTTYVNASRNRLDKVAVYVDDTGEQYTNKELLTLIDNASIGFQSLGINESSEIGIFLNGSIEEIITFLALSKLGAVSKFIDFMKGIPAIKHSLEESALDLLVMDERFLPLNPLINEKGLPVVVANSSNYYDDSNYISYEKLYQMNCNKDIVVAPYIDGKPSIIINSSGTTGEPKPIVHTDYSVNAATQKMFYTDYPLNIDHLLIKMVPVQIGLGLITSLYTGLIAGTMLVLISGKDVSELIKKTISFVKNFSQFRKKHQLAESTKLNVFTSPAFIRPLIKAKEVTDLSFIGSFLAAGSKMTTEELIELEQIAKGKGCKVPICNGYGQNEMAGAVTLNLNQYNINGSAGFPTFGTDVIVINPDTRERLSHNQTGLILEVSNSQFLMYEKHEKKTEQAYLTLPDGSCWFNTCDLGYMDKNGFLYITGRTTRVAIRSDAKISLDEIEVKIRSLPFIIDCAVIISLCEKSNDQITAFIKCDNITEKDLRKKIETENVLSEFEMPSEFLLIEELPYKTNGKVDYEKLKEMHGKSLGIVNNPR